MREGSPRTSTTAQRFDDAQSMAELAFALRVSSTASSRATGSSVRLAAPMIAMMTKSPPVSFLRTAAACQRHSSRLA